MALVTDEPKPIADDASSTPPVAAASDAPAAEPEVDASLAASDESSTPESDSIVPPAEDESEFAEWADDGDDGDAEEIENAAYESADAGDVAPIEEVTDADDEPVVEDLEMDWYILKVQSNREDSIAAALTRRVNMAGFEKFFNEIVVPVEMITEFKAGKRRVVKRKLYPGYIVVHMAINDETWFLVRETPGIGDFTGSAGRPTPMLPQEVSRIIKKDEDTVTDEPKLQIGFRVGDHVKINEGTFENFEGEVDTVDTTSGRVTVMINIFGRSTPVELEHWQIEAV